MPTGTETNREIQAGSSLEGLAGDNEESIQDADPRFETVEETAERIINELNSANESDDDFSAEIEKEQQPVSERKEAVAEKKGEEKEQEQTDDFDYSPPPYLDQEDLQLYNSIKDPAAKRILKKSLVVRNQKFTEFAQKTAQAEKVAQGYGLVNEYLHKNPELIEAGYDGPKLANALLANHMILTGADKTKARAKLLEIAQSSGIDIYSDGQPQNVQPQNVPLQPEVQDAIRYINELRSQNQINSIATEIESVMNEKDAAGNYLFPMTHNSQFLEQVKPSVQQLAQIMPYGEALKTVCYRYAAANPQGNLQQQPKATELPETQINERATQAAVSVRGKTSAPVSNGTSNIPQEALTDDVEKTVEWVLNNRR